MEESTIKEIKETKDYLLVAIGQCEKYPFGVYQIINKKYSVVEVESTIFPQALKYISDMQVALDALRDIEKPTPKLVTINP